MTRQTAKAPILTFVVIFALAVLALWFITVRQDSLSVSLVNNTGINLRGIVLSNTGTLLDQADLGIGQSRKLSVWSGKSIDTAMHMTFRIVLQTDADELFAARDITGKELIDCGRMLKITRGGNIQTSAEAVRDPVDR